MRDCDDALANLYLYLDSELDAASTEEIRAHLDECDDCSSCFDFEGRLRKVVKERLNEDVPDTLLAKVRQAIREVS